MVRSTLFVDIKSLKEVKDEEGETKEEEAEEQQAGTEQLIALYPGVVIKMLPGRVQYSTCHFLALSHCNWCRVVLRNGIVGIQSTIIISF